MVTQTAITKMRMYRWQSICFRINKQHQTSCVSSSAKQQQKHRHVYFTSFFKISSRGIAGRRNESEFEVDTLAEPMQNMNVIQYIKQDKPQTRRVLCTTSYSVVNSKFQSLALLEAMPHFRRLCVSP